MVAHSIADIETMRQGVRARELQGLSALPPLGDTIEEFWTTITLADGWESRTKVVRPKHVSTGVHPLIVLFHGGGFAVGSADMMTRPAREFAENFSAVVVCPTYKLAPEEPFPAGVKSAWAVLAHLSRNAKADLGADLDGSGGAFIVGGVSAGGTLASVTASISAFGLGNGEFANAETLAKPITGAFVNCPLTLTEDIVPKKYAAQWTSRDANRDGDHVETFIQTLQPDIKSPWFLAMNCLPKEPVAGDAPRFYIQIGGLDELRDDGLIFEKALAALGIPTKIDVFPDDGHLHWTAVPYQARATNPTVAEATMSGVEWLLQLRLAGGVGGQ